MPLPFRVSGVGGRPGLAPEGGVASCLPNWFERLPWCLVLLCPLKSSLNVVSGRLSLAFTWALPLILCEDLETGP